MDRLLYRLLFLVLLLAGCALQSGPRPTEEPAVESPSPVETEAPEASPQVTDSRAVTETFTANLSQARAYKSPTGELSSSLARLARDIVAGKKGETEKAVAIYDWLTQNIAYDVVALDSGDLGYKTPDSIVVRRKAVCSGYALLFHLFCQEVGLESFLVLGRSRADDQGLPPVLQDSPVNHAWNAVKIEGEWKLLDPTWGAGYIDQNRKFVKAPSKEWLFVPPEIFLYTHLPAEDKWQLLDEPIERDKFETLPILRPLFFAAGYQLLNPTHLPVRASGSTTFRVRSSKGNLLTAFVFQDGEQVPPGYVLPHQNRGQSNVVVRYPRAGDYSVYLVGRGAKSPSGVSVAAFKVKSSLGEREVFPETTLEFENRHCQIIRGFSGNLSTSQKAELVLRAPGATALTLEGAATAPFTNESGFFKASFVPRRGELRVVGRYEDAERVELLQYQGR